MATASKLLVDPSDPEQLVMFELGLPTRRKPTPEEVEEVLAWAVKMRVGKNWRGRPPKGMTFDDLKQEVAYGTLRKIKNFRHGGPKTFQEFTSMAAYQVLMDIAEKNMRRWLREKQEPQVYPLLDGTY